MINGDFAGGSVVKTSPSNAEAAGSSPRQGAKVPHAPGPNIKGKQYCKNVNKDFKNSPHQKTSRKNIINTVIKQKGEKRGWDKLHKENSLTMRKDMQVIINLYTFKHVLKCCFT